MKQSSAQVLEMRKTDSVDRRDSPAEGSAPQDHHRLNWLSKKFLDEGGWVQFCYWLRLHQEGTLREAIDSFMKLEERRG